MRKITLSIVALSAVLALVALTAGGAAAATETGWNGSSPVNDTFDIDNQTEALRVYATNITNDQASVSIYGVANGSETQVATHTIATDAANGTYKTQWTYSVDGANYSTLKVSVTGDGAEAISLAKVYVVRSGAGGVGGGGGLLDGPDVPLNELVAALLVVGSIAAAAVYSRS